MLENDFEGNGHAAAPLHRLEHFAKLAAAYGLDPREVVHGPRLLVLVSHFLLVPELATAFCHF